MTPSPGGGFTLEPEFSLIISQSTSPPSRLDILYDIDGQNFKGKHSIAAYKHSSTDKNNLYLPLFI